MGLLEALAVLCGVDARLEGLYGTPSHNPKIILPPE